MFQLQIADTDATNGNTAISWCLDKKLVEWVKENKCADPVVVLCISPADPNLYHIDKEVRRVVPLKDLMAYMEFRYPGKNNISGFISLYGKSCTENNFLERGWYGFRTSLLNNDGSDYSDSVKEEFPYSTQLSVDVPKECFAKEPSDAEKAWVYWLHDDRPKDQCQFRKHRMFAYSVQPFIFLLNILTKVLLMYIAMTYGSRGLSLDPLVHPLRESITSTWDKINPLEGSIFIGRGSNVFLNYARMIFMPLVLFAMFMIWYTHALVVVSVALVIVASIFLFFFMYYMEHRHSVFSNLLSKLKKQEVAWYLDEDNVNAVLCDGKSVKTFSSLPSKNKTIKLRFQDLKSKVCRPFAR
jgi:hypothetical protein